MVGSSVLSQENYQKPDKEGDSETVDGLHFMEEDYNPTQDPILRDFIGFKSAQPMNTTTTPNTSSGTGRELVLTRKNTATNKVCADVVHYEINETVGLFKDRVRRMFGFNNQVVLIFSIPNAEARELPDEETIGSFFPSGGAAELDMGGRQNQPEVGGYAIELNKTMHTAKQRNLIQAENPATATSRGGITRNEAVNESRQFNQISSNPSPEVSKGFWDD
ncbi:hypothetical protein PG996_005440 [Apiospora saccharicola]|uniref:Uncharacterized protein n=1 Tax=Apiospora saccharicola TaxID=335842 RepID=A0ABR1VLI9_9PEZI